MRTERPRAQPPKPSRATPAITLSPREWRLWLITALAGGYALVWLALAPDERQTAEPVGAAPVPSAAPPQVAWIDELPSEQRPPIVLPVGWTLDTGAPAPGRAPDLRRSPAAAAELVRQAPPIVRPARSRRGRVRTRSS